MQFNKSRMQFYEEWKVDPELLLGMEGDMPANQRTGYDVAGSNCRVGSGSLTSFSDWISAQRRNC